MDDNTMMWIWWGLTVIICAWKIGEGFLRPHRMLEWPFLASAMFAYFYGYMAFNAKRMMPEYLGNGISNIGQLMPLLCLIGIVAGWALGTRRSGQHVAEERIYPYFRVWLAGMFFILVGAAGAYSVMHSKDTGTLNYQEASGYWILLFYVGYPGMAMAIWALLKHDPLERKRLGFLTLLAVLGFMFPHIIDARRGPLFPAIIVLLLVPPLARRRVPNPWIFCGVLASAAAVMLIFLQVRVTIYNGGTWMEAAHRLDVGTALTEKVEEPEDNEYINNCQLIGTIYQTGKYQYGTGYLSLLAHWVPRYIWKDKPVLGEGSYTFDEMFDDVETKTGFRLLGTGAAAGGVADSFIQFGILCPLYWLALSWGMGVVYMRACVQNSPRWLFSYVGIICATHWLVSQSLSASSVPGMFFQAVPICVFLVLDPPHKRLSLASGNRRAAPRYPVRDQVVPS